MRRADRSGRIDVHPDLTLIASPGVYPCANRLAAFEYEADARASLSLRLRGVDATLS